MWPPQWCHVHHPSLLFRQFWGKLGNSSPTYLQVKQAIKSRHVSHAVLLPSVLWRHRQTAAYLVLIPKPRNCRSDFEAQITKLELPVLRPKLGNSSTLVLRQNQETCVPRLLVHGADRTWCHPTSRSSDHWVPDLCLIIPSPLHQVSYSCLDPCRCPSYRTYHLHTTRQVNVILHIR
jgi:hypothetical protein